jgi:hypothetical protein
VKAVGTKTEANTHESTVSTKGGAPNSNVLNAGMRERRSGLTAMTVGMTDGMSFLPVLPVMAILKSVSRGDTEGPGTTGVHTFMAGAFSIGLIRADSSL